MAPLPQTRPDTEPDHRIPANDNRPNKTQRLDELKAEYGGRIMMSSLCDCIVDGEIGMILVDDNGNELFRPAGRGEPRQLEQPATLNFVTAARWANKPIPDREWYIDELIPAKTVTIMNGDGGVGKSLLALQIAAAGSMDCDTVGLSPQAGRVVYVGAEDDDDEFKRRLHDVTTALDRDMASLTAFSVLSLADEDAILASPDKAGVMRPTSLWLGIANHVEAYKPKLLVLDTAADLFGGDEIKRSHVRSFIAMLRKLAIKVNCAVLLLAHPSLDGMRSGTGSSGSTAWNNSVRSRLYLTKPSGEDADPDVRILKTMKANYGKTGNEVRMRWKDGAFVIDDGRPSAAGVLLQARAERIFMDLLDNINNSGLRASSLKSPTYAPAMMADMPGADGVQKRELEAAMKRLLASGAVKAVTEGPASKRRQRLVVVRSD